MDGRPQVWDLIWDGMGDWYYSISAVNFWLVEWSEKEGWGLGFWGTENF